MFQCINEIALKNCSFIYLYMYEQLLYIILFVSFLFIFILIFFFRLCLFHIFFFLFVRSKGQRQGILCSWSFSSIFIYNMKKEYIFFYCSLFASSLLLFCTSSSKLIIIMYCRLKQFVPAVWVIVDNCNIVCKMN